MNEKSLNQKTNIKGAIPFNMSNIQISILALLISLLLLTVSCGVSHESGSNASASSETKGSSNNTDDAFTKIADEYWQDQLSKSPTFATTLGVRDYDDNLSDLSLEAYAKNKEDLMGFHQQLTDLDSNMLSKEQSVNFDILLNQITDDLKKYDHDIPKYNMLTNRGGPHLSLTRLPQFLPLVTKADFKSYLTRLGKSGTYIDQAIIRLNGAVERKYSHSCKSMEGYEDSISAHIVEDLSKSAFYSPFTGDAPDAIGEGQAWDDMKDSAKEVIGNTVVPAFERFHKFYVETYMPSCRDIDGVSSLEGGEEYYNYLLAHFTTTDKTADDIHTIGNSEVKRIRGEMADLIESTGFEGSFKDFQNFLRTDEQFYVKSGEELMKQTALVSKRIDEQLPKLFSKMPRMPFTLKPIPEDIAEKTTTAYYEQPAGDGTRAGVYRVNLSKLDTRPLFEIMALSLHEAEPGHHFQIALAQELDMPPYRRFAGFTAFVEGWALYAESLGIEVGLYKDDPYSNFGRLSYEMWRATRLVVDTGIHSKGWTRQQAIDFMAENTALSIHNITSEVDRYITWPGQATAYKIGELHIKSLRAKAEKELGPKFDKRLFHDAVLENGSIPLALLEKNVDKWIASQK